VKQESITAINPIVSRKRVEVGTKEGDKNQQLMISLGE